MFYKEKLTFVINDTLCLLKTNPNLKEGRVYDINDRRQANILCKIAVKAIIDRELFLARKLYRGKCCLWLRWNHHFGSFTLPPLLCQQLQNIISLFMSYHRACNKSNTTVATSEAGSTFPSGELEFIPWVLLGLFCSIVRFLYMFCR
jgi:hypothetical protein